MKAWCFVSWCTEGTQGLWVSPDWPVGDLGCSPGSSNSGSNPVLLGKGTVSGCRGTFRVWGNSSSIMSFYSVWDIPVSTPCPNYEMVKHRTTRCLGDLLWDCDVPFGWTNGALSICRSFPSTYWCRRFNVATLHFIQGATEVYLVWGTKIIAAKSYWRRWRWAFGRLVLVQLLLWEDPPGLISKSWNDPSVMKAMVNGKGTVRDAVSTHTPLSVDFPVGIPHRASLI